MKVSLNGLTFDDSDVVNARDFWMDYPIWMIYSPHGVLAVVVADTSQDALDYAADAHKLDSCKLSQSEIDELTESEQEQLYNLGNYGEFYDLSDVSIQELGPVQFSLCGSLVAAGLAEVI